MLPVSLLIVTVVTCSPTITPSTAPLTLLPSANISDIIADDAFCKLLRPPGYATLQNNETHFPYDMRAFWYEPDVVYIYLMNGMGFTWRGVLLQVRHEDVPLGTFTYIRNQDGLQEALVNCPPARANTFYLTSTQKFYFLSILWHPPEGFTMNQTIIVHMTVMLKPGKHYWRQRLVKPIVVDNMTADDVSFYGLEHHISNNEIIVSDF